MLNPMAKIDYRLKANRRTRAPQQIYVRRHHIFWIQGMLIQRLRRPVSWREIAALTGLTPRWIANLVHDRRNGGIKTAQRLLKLREYGLMIHLEDFSQPDPPPVIPTIPEYPQTLRWSPRRKPVESDPGSAA